MLLAPSTPKVEPIPGEDFRYVVHSSRQGQAPHMVDLEARFPLGRCSCESYEFKRWPNFKQTLYPVRCRHLTAALEYHALQDIRNRSKQLNGEGE